MKRVTVLVLLSLVAVSCSTTFQKKNKNVFFEYEAATRGVYYKIIANRDSVITIHDRAMEKVTKRSMVKKDWNVLVQSLKNVDRKQINNLEAPTDKRLRDAALHAELKIIDKGETYESSMFDHGNPPDRIKPLVEKLIEISDLKK